MRTHQIAYTQASIVRDIWAGAGVTMAPPASNFIVGAIGANNGGINTALTYHVFDNAGTKVWIATGGTVQQLYGGA